MEIKVIHVPADVQQPAKVMTIERSLDSYQTLVGGNVQFIPIHNPGASVFFHEEGKFQEKPPNPRATIIGHRHQGLARSDYIAGDAYISGPVDGHGFELPVDDYYLRELEAR